MTNPKPRPTIVHGETHAYPVLPLRDIVVFPHMIVPLFVGREKSIRALEEVMKNDALIMLATQKNASDDDPAPDAIYETGTLASVLQLLKLPDGTVKVLVEGLERARVQKYTDRADYYEATAVALADTDAKSVEAEALARSVVSDFESYVKLNKKISAEVVGVVQAITDFAKLADTVASHLAGQDEGSMPLVGERPRVDHSVDRPELYEPKRSEVTGTNGRSLDRFYRLSLEVDS
jgi:ATP-dependent Lon protease